jgi:signal transduction histidine kinase
MGTGLGLFISKGIVDAHGVKIWAENNPDRGATFSFSLPINNEFHIRLSCKP